MVLTPTTELSSASPAVSLAELLGPLQKLAARNPQLASGIAGRFCCSTQHHAIPCFRFIGPTRGHDPIRLGLFAGVHGDEPAGCAALVQFLTALVAEPQRAAGYELFVYPVVNPAGYADRTRANRSGKDLNREFWQGSLEPEVRIVEDELRLHAFAGVITLHADDTCEGHYGYSHGRELDDALLRPALLAAERVLPRDRRAVIDGFSAREGVIADCFQGILAPPPDQKPQPFNLIFETPALAPFAHQVEANVAALDAILASYRGFISYAQDL
jgi:hypothetical protein